MVAEPVDWRYGVTSMAIQAEKTPGELVLLLQNVMGYSMPVLVNLLGTVDRIHLALEGAKLGGRHVFYRDWNTLFDRTPNPTHAKICPVHEVTHMGS